MTTGYGIKKRGIRGAKGWAWSARVIQEQQSISGPKKKRRRKQVLLHELFLIPENGTRKYFEGREGCVVKEKRQRKSGVEQAKPGLEG